MRSAVLVLEFLQLAVVTNSSKAHLDTDCTNGHKRGPEVAMSQSRPGEGAFGCRNDWSSDESSLRIAEEEVFKVELMYSSRNSEPFVCPCLANLYEYGKRSSSFSDDWTLLTTGIPLLVVESSECHPELRLYIRVAELGTGFTLWKQPVSPFTRYCAVDSSFHTLFTNNTSGCKTVGISFDHSPSAKKFYQHLRTLQANMSNRGRAESAVLSANQLCTTAANGLEGRTTFGKVRRTQTTIVPSKSSISGPCCFKHITCLRPGDMLTSYEALTSRVLSRSEHGSFGLFRRALGRATQSFNNLSDSRDLFL